MFMLAVATLLIFLKLISLIALPCVTHIQKIMMIQKNFEIICIIKYHYYKRNGQIVPNMATDVPLEGQWINNKSQRPCDPQIDNDCQYILTGSNDQVTCSLGSLHFLPSVKRFCSADQLLGVGPTKHNVLCKGQSTLDVILDHDNRAIDLSSTVILHD